MQDVVAETKAAIDSLAKATSKVADEFGDTLGVRRLRSDVARLRDDLVELGGPAPGHQRRASPDDVVEIDDKPYDESMWDASDSEAQHAQ